MLRRTLSGAFLLLALLIAQTISPVRAQGACDSAQFVADVTIPDGTAFAPGAAFTKTWRLLNSGTCAWTASYKVVLVGGDALGPAVSVNLPAGVASGETVDISVNLTASMQSGHYRGLWKLSNPSGSQFGIGAQGNEAFWVDIQVVETSAVIFDLAANAPYATWKSEKGILPYPGTSGDSRGYSYPLGSPHLEDGSSDPQPGMLVVPQNKTNGYIQAVYPEMQFQVGDRLQTLVNCEFGAKGCYVTFRVDYLTASGSQRTLWSWKEAYEGRFYRADIDLSRLAGQKVRLALTVLSTGPASGDRAIWGSPRIVRTGSTQPPAPPATLTPLPPLTPTATPFSQPPPVVAPSGCDKASFVADITVPDGTHFTGGSAFTKTWRIKNTGGCGWTTAYRFLFYSGERMSAPTSISMPRAVAPGQTVDLTVNMVAPGVEGKYRGNWILSNGSGGLFGIGSQASLPIWVEINVAGGSLTEMGYDFQRNACSAQWRSGSGPLPCPGTEGDAKGFVTAPASTRLEDGTMGPAPSLLVAPENRYNGYIQGIYPTFTVQPGDRFYSSVGCEYGFRCYVTFQLDYMTATGSIRNFWTWREQNEGLNHIADLDLTPLAGQSVRFILTINAAGSASGDRARWSAPFIRRAELGVPTLTPVPPPITPTASATPTPPVGDWTLYTNSFYGFQFRVPPGSVISGEQDNFARVDLPFAAGTNLKEKILEAIVIETAGLCRGSLPSNTSEIVNINGMAFLKETGGDGGAGHLRQWIVYSIARENVCVSLNFILHSLNPGNFPTPPPVFDMGAETAVLNDILPSYAWLTPVPVTATPPGGGLALVQSVEAQIVETQPLGVNAVVRGQLPDGCTHIAVVGQVRDGSTFRLTLTTARDSLAACDPAPVPFEQVVPLEVGGLPIARYTVEANGVQTSFKLMTRDLNKFLALLVEALNARDESRLRVLMEQNVMFAYWQSQGVSFTADEVIAGLGGYFTTGLVPDPGKDLNSLLDGLDAYAIMGLDPAKSKGLFVSGWGVDGNGEAILYAVRLPDGNLHWYGILIAPSKFVNP